MSDEIRTDTVICPVYEQCVEETQDDTTICKAADIKKCKDKARLMEEHGITDDQETQEAPAQEEPKTEEITKVYSTEYLKCPFTQDELNKLASDMARFYMDKTNFEADKKAVASDYKAKIEAADARINEIAVHLSTGFEMRTIKCELSKDFEERKVYTYRMDTGELVETRDMTDSEMQMSFRLAEGEDSEPEEIKVETIINGFVAAGQEAPDREVIESWTQEQRMEVSEWISLAFDTNNLIGHVPPRPDFLEADPDPDEAA